jgi:predicted Holliday junction resolvase-like endonuclease
MNIQQLIVELMNSQLYAECTCGEEFKLSDAILFDGSKPFPTEAVTIQDAMKTELQEREDELKQRIKNATKKAQVTTKAVNIGKNLEKILPTMADFKWVVPDSRFLGDPIDLITFNGLSQNNVDSISFIEVKSGNAKLNNHQKSIRNAIEDHKVSYKGV